MAQWKETPEILLDQIAAIRDEYAKLKRDMLDQMEWSAAQGDPDETGRFSLEAEKYGMAHLAASRIFKLINAYRGNETTECTRSYKDGVEAAAKAIADELIALCEAGARKAKRTGDTFVLDRSRLVTFVRATITQNLHRPAPSPSVPGETAPAGDAETWPEPKVTNPDIADPTGIPYIDCLIHRLLDAQQNINYDANLRMSQSLCDASALIDEVETAIRRLASLRAAPQWRTDQVNALARAMWQLLDDMGEGHAVCDQAKQEAISALEPFRASVQGGE